MNWVALCLLGEDLLQCRASACGHSLSHPDESSGGPMLDLKALACNLSSLPHQCSYVLTELELTVGANHVHVPHKHS